MDHAIVTEIAVHFIRNVMHIPCYEIITTISTFLNSYISDRGVHYSHNSSTAQLYKTEDIVKGKLMFQLKLLIDRNRPDEFLIYIYIARIFRGLSSRFLRRATAGGKKRKKEAQRKRGNNVRKKSATGEKTKRR